MKNCMLLALGMILSGAAAMAQEDPAKTEAAKLQGAWQVVSLEGGGRKAPEKFFEKMRFLVQGDKLSLSGKEADLHKYRLDVTTKPKAIDLFDDAATEFSKAVYEVDGDTLRLCFSQLTTVDRPKGFDTTGTKDYLCFTLKRIKP